MRLKVLESLPETRAELLAFLAEVSDGKSLIIVPQHLIEKARPRDRHFLELINHLTCEAMQIEISLHREHK